MHWSIEHYESIHIENVFLRKYIMLEFRVLKLFDRYVRPLSISYRKTPESKIT